MTGRRIDDGELHALVDGELDPARQAEVEAWLSENPDAAGRVARYRAQNAGLHALFDGVLDEELPPAIDIRELMVRAATAHVVNSDEDMQLAASGSADDIGRYLSTRMGGQVRVPQLTSLGYRLVGSRVLPDTGGPAAQFVFEDAGGERISLYVRTEAARGLEITFALADDLSMFYWNDSKHSYALVRDLEDESGRAALLKAAQAVYRQIAE
jgi:anti-sigma factor RsiW